MTAWRRLTHPPVFVVALAAAMAAPAHAHVTNTGFGPFYDGLAHLFLTPEGLLPVVALSLAAGLRGPRFGRVVLFALPVASLAGSFVGRLVLLPSAPPVATAAITITLGALAAADKRSPLAVL